MAYVWSCFQDGVPFDMVQKEGEILMWAAKWIDDKNVIYETRQKGEKNCLKKLWNLIDEAEIIVAHNGDRFDIPTMNGYFLRNGMTPPSRYRTIDTLKIARNRFKFMSNRLDHLGKTLGLGRKVTHTGFKLWLGCMAGNKKDWDTMKKYNVQDVMLLERIYKKFLPWINNHPNMGTYVDPEKPCCKNCGCTKLRNKGMEYTNFGSYRRYSCTGCGAPLRGRQNQLKKNPNILT